MPETIAQTLLKATSEDLKARGQSYSQDGHDQERNMNNIVAAFNAITGHKLSEMDGWLFMIALKAVRCGRGAKPNVDSFQDGAGYFALAGELHVKTSQD